MATEVTIAAVISIAIRNRRDDDELMWENLFSTNVPFINLIIRAVVVYVAILILMRVSGKREIGHMGVIEFVTVLLISNAVQNSMNAGDNSLLGGLILAGSLVALSLAFSEISYRSRFFARVIEGTPTLLINQGELIVKNLQRERMRESELRVLLRKQGIHHYSEIANAILEADGTLSITKVGDLKMDSEMPNDQFGIGDAT